MEIKKKIKKGFTLIELVVVIAVIAILSAVSVAAYFGVINSSRQSVAEQECYQVRLALQTEAIPESKEISFDTNGKATAKYGTDGLTVTVTAAGSSTASDAKLITTLSSVFTTLFNRMEGASDNATASGLNGTFTTFYLKDTKPKSFSTGTITVLGFDYTVSSSSTVVTGYQVVEGLSVGSNKVSSN